MKFYTLPPVPYPYILINANNPQVSFVRKFRGVVKSIILDSGIEIFQDPAVKDYPRTHIEKVVTLHNKIQRLFPDATVWATVPDYCDDYHPRNLWIDEDITNSERTVANILKCVDVYDYVNWLIPIQGWNQQPNSIKRCVEQLEQQGIIQDFQYFAIGNLCVEPNKKLIFETAKVARQLLPNKKLHIFGLKLTAVPLVQAYIDSFDSMAWTRPVNSSLKVNGVGWSCKTTEERKRFFNVWLNRLNYLLAQKTLDNSCGRGE